MVAREQADTAGKTGRVVGHHLRTGLLERLKKAAHRRPQAADPIVHQHHVHALAAFFHQQIAQPHAEIVGGENIHFNQHIMLGSSHCFQPGGKVFAAVLQELHAVAAVHFAAAGTRMQLVEQRLRVVKEEGAVGHDVFSCGFGWFEVSGSLLDWIAIQ